MSEIAVDASMAGARQAQGHLVADMDWMATIEGAVA